MAGVTPTRENRGLLPAGTVLPDGAVVLHTSLTAYQVRPADPDLQAAADLTPDLAYALARSGGAACEWRSFDAVHGGPFMVEPLLVWS